MYHAAFSWPKSFILTMWYVNTAEGKQAKLDTIRFILTMWYVNDVMALAVEGKIPSFILTMWYVNK